MNYDIIHCCPGCRGEAITKNGVILTHDGPSGLVCKASRVHRRDAYAQLLREMQRAKVLEVAA